MLNNTKITYNILYLMLFSPLLSYLTFGYFNLRPITFYLQIIVIFYGFLLIINPQKKREIPGFAYFALFWSFYLFIWMFFDGSIERRGLLAILLNNWSLAIFFVLIIIYNTKFTDKFIQNTIRIFWITVVTSATVSILQVFDIDFFDATPYWMEEFRYSGVGLYTQRRLSIFGFIDHNALGLSYLPLLAVFVGYLIKKKDKSYFSILMLGAVTSAVSNNRYVIGSFIIVTFHLFFQVRYRITGIIRYLVVSALLLIISFFMLESIGYDMKAWYDSRLLPEGHLTKTTRFGAITAFSYFFPDYYLFGNGAIYDEDVTSFSRSVIGSSHIHVGYLSHLVAYGIIGCFFLYGFWFLLAKKLYKTAKNSNYWGSFFAFLTFWWAFATFSNSSIFYYGLIFALVFDKYFIDQATEKMIKGNNFEKT